MAEVQEKHNVFRRSADVVIRRLSRHRSPSDPPVAAVQPHVDPNATSARGTDSSTTTDTCSPVVVAQPHAEQAHHPAHDDQAHHDQPPMPFWSRVIGRTSSVAPSECIPPGHVPESSTATGAITSEPLSMAGTSTRTQAFTHPPKPRKNESSPERLIPSPAADFNPFDVLQLGTVTLQGGKIRRASESVQPTDLIPLQSRDSVPRRGSGTSSGSRASGTSSTNAATSGPNKGVASPPRTPRLMAALDFGDVVQDHVLIAASKLRHPSRSRTMDDRPPWVAPVGQGMVMTQSEVAVLDAKEGGQAKQQRKSRSYSVVGLTSSQAMAHHKAIKSIHGYRGHGDLMPVFEDATATAPKQRSASVDMGT